MRGRRDLIEAERLGLQRDEAALWTRLGERKITQTRADLSRLQRALETGLLDLETLRDRRGLGVAFGMILAHELGLDWVRLADDFGVELALGKGEPLRLSHPLPMIEQRADDGRAIDLAALFDSVARLYERDESAAPPAWKANFEPNGAELEGLERQLGTLASTLQVSANLAYVMIRGACFSVVVDAGRGDANDLTMQVSFAGERAMLVVGGGLPRDPAERGAERDLHEPARRDIERAIDDYVRAHPEHDALFAPFTEGSAENVG